MDPDWVDVSPTKNGDIPASYVSLPEGNIKSNTLPETNIAPENW